MAAMAGMGQDQLLRLAGTRGQRGVRERPFRPVFRRTFRQIQEAEECKPRVKPTKSNLNNFPVVNFR
jgi:hypothetical protein